jgi:hypothetical protein
VLQNRTDYVLATSAQRIAAQAKKSGYNVIRYPSERGHGANLAVLCDFENVLTPQKIITIPNKQPPRLTISPWNQ